jgi:hypothetical protein
MTASVVAPACVPMPAEGLYRRALAALRAATRRGLRFRIRCLLLGHEDSFARQPRRLMLRCATCSRETVGWAIGPGTPAVMAAPRTSPQRRTAVVDTAVRVGPWTLRRREGRGEARDRQRQRLVVAASRATERSADDIGRGEPARERSRLRPLAHEPQPDRWMDVARRAGARLVD